MFYQIFRIGLSLVAFALHRITLADDQRQVIVILLDAARRLAELTPDESDNEIVFELLEALTPQPPF